MEPIIFDLKEGNEKERYQDFLQQRQDLKVVDTLEDQLRELFLVRNPKLKRNPEQAEIECTQYISSQGDLREQGIWVYLPWNNSLVHILSKEDFYELRTARNKNLIIEEEQQKFRKATIGIIGLSVGNSIALSLALEGGSEHMRLADFDELAVSNTNRIRAGIQSLGKNKTEITAEQIYELNPYANLELVKEKMNPESLRTFLTGLDLVVDEMDDVEAKVQLRLFAQELQIPVVSAADNGDNVILDIERYDIDANQQLFHGRIGNIQPTDISKMDAEEKTRLIAKMVGIEYVASRMKSSFLEVGNTLYSWPQLGGAAMLCGAAAVFVIKQIVLGGDLQSGKYDVNIERILMPDYDSEARKIERAKETEEFLKRQEEMF